MSKRITGRSSAFSRKPVVIATEIAIAMLAAQVAYGQQVAQAPVERVEITGSRLPQLTTEGVTPVSTLTAQDIKLDGLSKAEDLLRNLPQAYQNQGTYQANGATGTATVDLRGLGPNRNLVLINGRRMVPGTPTQGGYAPDLNQIPTPLIQRVELLTGGNSAIYGSDAITGVINFIMNDKFEGLRIDFNHSFYNHQQNNPNGIADIVRARALTNPTQFVVPNDVASDGDIHDISMTLGGNFANGKGNATVFLQYKREDPVIQATRDFSACSLNPSNVAFTCGGSGTSFPGQFLTAAGARTVADALGNTRPFVAATDQFNFGPYNYYQRPSEKYLFSAFAHLDVTPHNRVYAELGYHQDQTVAQIAPSGLFGLPVTLSSENPLLPNVIGPNTWRGNLGLGLIGSNTTADAIILRRNLEGGGRQDDIKHSSFRMVFGMKGDFLKHWNYDVFAQTSRVNLSRVYRNDFSNTRAARAMNVVADPGTGAPVCASVLDGTDPACVPYDIWRLGGVTGAALNYLQIPLLANGSTQQQVHGGNVSADLGNYGLKSPWAKDGIGFVFGLERRKEKLELETDTNFSSGDGAGQGGATIGRSGKIKVDEWYTELRVPLIEGRRFADLLSINGAYRHSKYSTGITTKTHALGVEWAPIRQYRFRGSYQRAVRAANINELFLAQGNNLFDQTGDPCGPAALAAANTPALLAALQAACARTGLAPGLIGNALLDSPAGQFNFLQGGNPQLKPEEADTYTAGVVFNPIRNLTGSLDWWSIYIDGAIGNAPPTTILQQCFNNNNFCNLVQRDAFGTLWLLPQGRVVALNDNLGGYKVQGVDLALNYLQRIGRFGSLNFNYNGSWLDKWEFEPIKGLGKFDCAGFVGPQCGFPLPKYRHKARITWTTPWNVDLAATWRHIGKTQNETLSGDPDLSGATLNTDRELASRDYLDLAFSWVIDKSLTVRGGVNNVFDKDPPIISSVFAGPAIFGNGNTFPGTYDTLGRTIFIGLTAKW